MTPTRARAALAEAAVHALLAGDVLALQPMVSPHVVDHAAEPGQPEGWRGLRERVMTLCAALPDGDVTVDVLRLESDTVLARAVITAVRRVAGPEPVEVDRPLTVRALDVVGPGGRGPPRAGVPRPGWLTATGGGSLLQREGRRPCRSIPTSRGRP